MLGYLFLALFRFALNCLILYLGVRFLLWVFRPLLRKFVVFRDLSSQFHDFLDRKYDEVLGSSNTKHVRASDRKVSYNRDEHADKRTVERG